MYNRKEEKSILLGMLSLIVEVSIIFIVLFLGMSIG